MFVCLLGAIATSFLPETFGAKLPDTVKVKLSNIFSISQYLNISISSQYLPDTVKVKLSDLLLIHKIKIKMFSFQDSNLFGRSDDYLSFKPLRQ